MIMDKYNTMLLTEIWEDSEEFKTEYLASGLAPDGQRLHTSDDVKAVENGTNIYYNDYVEILYGLLYAKFGGTPIANLTVNQFKYKLFSIIYKYGPTWEKKIELQEKLRELSEDDLLQGSKAIHNHAFGDATAPGTSTLEETAYINDQNTTNYKRSKIEGYSILWEALSTDVTENFLRQFQVCFKRVVAPEFGPRIISDIDEED